MVIEEETDQETEIANALKEKRQPICVYCHHKIVTIKETQTEHITFTWNAKTKGYDKDDNDGESLEPYHYCTECPSNCEAHDWAFTNNGLMEY